MDLASEHEFLNCLIRLSVEHIASSHVSSVLSVPPPDDGEVLGQLGVDRLVEAEERREGEHRDEEEVQPQHQHLQRGV